MTWTPCKKTPRSAEMPLAKYVIILNSTGMLYSIMLKALIRKVVRQSTCNVILR